MRIRQLYEVRGAIDALAARLAAGRVKTDIAARADVETALRAGRSIDRKTPLAKLIASMSIFTARSTGCRAIPRLRK